MGVMLEAALEYAKELHYSVMPVRADKKPYLSEWLPYQQRIAKESEIRAWWEKWSDANVGIITGMISGLAVIDLDDLGKAKVALNSLIPDSLSFPVAQTPAGGEHWFFRCVDPEVKNAQNDELGFDVRGNGGYVVAAPSHCIYEKKGRHIDGCYKWLDDLKPKKITPPFLPRSFVNFITGKKTESLQKQAVAQASRLFDEGNRDHNLFLAACSFIRDKRPIEWIYEAVRRLALSCTPPFSPEEADRKVLSAIKAAQEQPRDLCTEVKQWVAVQDGAFRLDGCFNELALQTKEQKAECRKGIIDLSKQGILERDKGIGIYRLLRKDIDFISIPDEEMPPLDFSLPLGIHSWAQIRQRNVVIFTGISNSGKTAMTLNAAMRNMDKFKIRYQSSEMTGDELYTKLKHMPRTLQEFREKVEWVNRASDWWDIVLPDAVNIIDFMEIYENFYEVGGWIKKVHDRLTTGIAIIVLQKKDSNTDTGRGGAITKEKARLYLSMDFGCLTIVKAKHWVDHQDPNGKKIDFTLEKGVNFKSIGQWR